MDKDYQIARLQGIEDDLRRIKEQELQWFGIFLLLQGSLFAFITNIDMVSYGLVPPKDEVKAINYDKFRIVYSTIVVVGTLIWGWLAVNLRRQYYTRIRARMWIQKYFNDPNTSHPDWYEQRFLTWWWINTRPLETGFALIAFAGFIAGLSIGVFYVRADKVFHWYELVLYPFFISAIYLIVDYFQLKNFHSKIKNNEGSIKETAPTSQQ